jgi:myo-inositol-1(or 4)-monophosphatase
MKSAVLSKIHSEITQLARRVGDSLYQNSAKRKRISYKGAVDLVTQFDRQSQKAIVEYCTRHYPKYGILSEEDVHRSIDAPIKWIIDPLDGTTNFCHGLPIWSISIALEEEGAVVMGIVYDPTRQEMFSAMKGKGAYLNGRRIRVSGEKRLDRALLVTGFPYDIRTSRENNLDLFSAFAKRAQAVRRLGSAALDLCYTAAGRFDGYWELKLSPWDQAAGSLILKEAGGTISDFTNKEFNIYGDQVLATNGHIHRQMMSVVKTVRSGT